jgi:hypothetical protein
MARKVVSASTCLRPPSAVRHAAASAASSIVASSLASRYFRSHRAETREAEPRHLEASVRDPADARARMDER